MSFDPSQKINDQLPWPNGESQSSPKNFNEVAPVVVEFFRRYVGVGCSWFMRNSSSLNHSIYLNGSGCSGGGSKPYQERWIDLVAAPVIGYDHDKEDVSEIKSCQLSDFSLVQFSSVRFPKDLKDALILVAQKDLEVMKKWQHDLTQMSHSSGVAATLHNKIEYLEKLSDFRSFLNPEHPRKGPKLGR